MNRMSVVAPALVVMLALACGGGTSPTPTPTSPTPTPPSPSSITAYASYDNLVRVSSSSSSDAEMVFPSHEIAVGWDYGNNPNTPPYGWFSSGYGSALKFEVQSQIAGRAVAQATLRLYVMNLRHDFSITPQIRVNAFTSDWDASTLTWNIWAGLVCYATGEAQAAAPTSSAAPLDFDVTTIVRNWASGSWNNYGVRLMVNPSDPGYTPSLGTTWFYTLEIFRTQNERPQLIIDFQ